MRFKVPCVGVLYAKSPRCFRLDDETGEIIDVPTVEIKNLFGFMEREERESKMLIPIPIPEYRSREERFRAFVPEADRDYFKREYMGKFIDPKGEEDTRSDKEAWAHLEVFGDLPKWAKKR